MASTRNINTQSDYNLQQKSFRDSLNYNTYLNSSSGQASRSSFPCVGINMGNMPANVLSVNSVDIESGLFGINSTNLVNPQPPVIAEINKMEDSSFFERKPVYLPDPLVHSITERPFPVPQ